MDKSLEISPLSQPADGEGEPVAAPKRQALRSRVFWFLVGAIVNYILISTPFNYLKTHTALPALVISGCSVGVGTVFFFFWNYFVNFRSDVGRRDALVRYLFAVGILWMASSSVLTLLKMWDFHFALHFPGGKPVNLDFDVVATQLFTGWLKFLIYHFWVFPARRRADA
jgi:hypothetical protein